MHKYSLLIVTRETAEDKTYGLGKSIQPIQDELEKLGWTVDYFCQANLSAAQQQQKSRWIQRIHRWTLAPHFHHEALFAALVERLFMGYLGAQEQTQKAHTHVHLHDPWLALGFLLGQALRKLSRWGSRLSQALPPPPKRGITQHGFGAYFQAVRWDGVHIGPIALFLLKHLESAICQRMHWVLAPTQLALDQLGMDLGLVKSVPEPLPVFVPGDGAGPRSLDEAHMNHSLGSNSTSPPTLLLPLPLPPPLPKHWIPVPHALPKFNPMPQLLAREQLGLDMKESDKILLSVGRLAPLKQFDLVIRVFAELFVLHPDLHLIILGGGESSALKALAQEKGVGSRVHFMATQNVDPYYCAANLYVSASLSESFGLANLESLSHQLPSVCTRVGGVPEVVQNGAVLVEPHHEPILKALHHLLSHPHEANELSLRASERIKNWPSTSSIAQTYVQIYTQAKP